jgi:hypothetical protein
LRLILRPLTSTPLPMCPHRPNAVSFSSACTMNRFPSPRCASAIQIVRPQESIAETQPQLQPDLLRLSGIVSHYFTKVRDFCLLWLYQSEARFCTAIVLMSCSILTLDGKKMMRRLHKIRGNLNNKR